MKKNTDNGINRDECVERADELRRLSEAGKMMSDLKDKLSALRRALTESGYVQSGGKR